MVVGRRCIAVRAGRWLAVAVVLAAPAVGHAQIDLNQYFPKVSSLSPSSATAYNDPPPDPSQFNERAYQGRSSGAPRYPYRGGPDQFGAAPDQRGAEPEELMSQRAGGPTYQSPRRSPMRNAEGASAGSNAWPLQTFPGANPFKPQSSQAQPQPQPNRSMAMGGGPQGDGGVPYYQRPNTAGRQGMSGQRAMSNQAAMPARVAMNNRSPAMRQRPASQRITKNAGAEMIATPQGPVVTPDAVYLDGTMQSVMSPDDESMSDGMMQGPMYGGPMMEGGPPMYGSRGPDGFTNPYCNDCDSCGGGCNTCGRGGGWRGDCLDCGDCCGNRPSCWLLAPCGWLCSGMWHQGPYGGQCDPRGNWWWGQDFTVFGGAQAFQSPVDLGVGSNHGFNEGFNWSMPLWRAAEVGAQFGLRFTQNNFGDTRLDDSTRTQTFLTTGLFHRPGCGQGAQYGLVFDWLHDDYYDTFSVAQLRGELSWLCDCVNEVGFMFAAGVHNDTVHEQFQNQTLLATYEPIDQYAFFYRRRFCGGGEGRLWGGLTREVNGGLFGADFRVPLAPRWSIDGGFNYLFASNDDHGNNNSQSFSNDTWNVGVNLVWNFGGNACGCNATRPLFNVADNGSFMVTRHGQVPNISPISFR